MREASEPNEASSGLSGGGRAEAAPRARAPARPGHDRAALAILGFFVAVALGLELPWLLHARTLATEPSWIGRIFAVYAACDRSYYDAVSPLALSLEGLNVWVTQPLGLVIMWGILRRRPWRHPLQLAVGAYLAYSVVLYFLHAHVGGYPDMPRRSAAAFALFYGVNLPWLVGGAWLAWSSFRALAAALGQSSAHTAARPAP